MKLFAQKNMLARMASLSMPILFYAALLAGCEDDTSKIGNSLATGETDITLDSISYNLNASSLEYTDFDSRSGNLMLGNLNVKEYGKLNCSFVSRLMCATSLNLPDSLLTPERVDSCFILLGVGRGDITGDSLTPQKLAVYKLDKQLPAGITNKFDPAGYYNPDSPLGVESYTTSLIAENDSIFLDKSNVGGFYIEVPVSKELGREIFTKYKKNPEIFQWPQSFAQYFPGIYVKPFFGKGCVANVQKVYLAIFYHTFVQKSTVVDGETKKEWVKQARTVIPFSASPEVLSSNNISYEVSDYIKNMASKGENVITTPGGYLTNFKFPTEELIRKYNASEHNLSMVSNLTLSIPAEVIENDYGIGATPSLLLIKSSEMKDFFAQNKLPDNKTSFTATYNSSAKKYTFSSMRQYILDMMAKGELTDDDVTFTVVPVEITQETQESYGTTTTYTTKCTPYTSKPTMTRLHTEDAMIVFSFSSQYIK